VQTVTSQSSDGPIKILNGSRTAVKVKWEWEIRADVVGNPAKINSTVSAFRRTRKVCQYCTHCLTYLGERKNIPEKKIDKDEHPSTVVPRPNGRSYESELGSPD
jgi:hypothetical protein